jgi:spoIIIJ-associated protein
MSDNRTSLEIIAPSVEEAVANGLEELGLPEEAVDVEVLDVGSKGLFGLGSRQARVKLSVKTGEPGEKKSPTNVVSPVMPMPMPVAGPVGEIKPREPEPDLGDEDPSLRIARQTVSELLLKMKVKAKVTARYVEQEEPQSRISIWVDIRGEDLSFLIGPKSETLIALQYISSQIIAKELDRSIALTLDVQGYRARREQQIRQLARRMADQAIKTGRRQVLEPMPANERRWVHMELRANPDVSTESIGEDPRRKVTINPTPAKKAG